MRTAIGAYLRCPDDAMRTATATMNINNMLPSNIYVLLDDLRYSPNKTTPQNVLTSGSACNEHISDSRIFKISNGKTRFQI